MKYAVLHIQKGGTSTGALGQHIDRSRTPDNADEKKAMNNFRIINGLKTTLKDPNNPSMGDRVEKRLKEGYKGKKTLRKDAVKFLNLMLTGSHEELANRTLQEIEQWAKANYNWVCDKYGEANVVGFAVHMDERTPHIHCTVVPLTIDGRLSAKEIVGDKHKLTALQDEYAMQMEQFGLERGKRNTKARHVSTKAYYAVINSFGKVINEALEYLRNKKKEVEVKPTTNEFEYDPKKPGSPLSQKLMWEQSQRRPHTPLLQVLNRK